MKKAGLVTLSVWICTMGFGGQPPKLVKAWTCGGLDTPEAVLYDAERSMLYVSNISGKPAEKNGAGLQSGSTAPAIQAPDQNGNPWILSDHLGHYVVIYFYPAAMTGGCTKQACSYRDYNNETSDLDIEIVGISGDTPASLKFFQQANQLNFTLLSDPDGTIAKHYGVPVKTAKKSIQRTVDGRDVTLERSNTAARWTCIIDPPGQVADIKKQVKAATDRNAVIEFIRNHEAR